MTPHAMVKVRWTRGSWTGQTLPAGEAARLTEQLRHDVLACGTGDAFVSFTGHDGREVHVRGREVVAVEYVPDLPARYSGAATVGAAVENHDVGEASGGRVSIGAVPDFDRCGPPASATAWLQRRARRTPEQVADAAVRE